MKELIGVLILWATYIYANIYEKQNVSSYIHTKRGREAKQKIKIKKLERLERLYHKKRPKVYPSPSPSPYAPMKALINNQNINKSRLYNVKEILKKGSYVNGKHFPNNNMDYYHKKLQH